MLAHTHSPLQASKTLTYLTAITDSAVSIGTMKDVDRLHAKLGRHHRLRRSRLAQVEDIPKYEFLSPSFLEYACVSFPP